MHSSRMRTVRNSGRIWGGGSAPRGGVCLGGLLWGVSAAGGVSAPGGGSGCLLGGCLLPVRGVWVSALEGVSVPRGCVCSGVCVYYRGCLLLGGLLPGVCSGGCLLQGGVCLLLGVSAPGGGVSALGGVVCHHALRQSPPPPLWTDRCL